MDSYVPRHLPINEAEAIYAKAMRELESKLIEARVNVFVNPGNAVAQAVYDSLVKSIREIESDVLRMRQPKESDTKDKP